MLKNNNNTFKTYLTNLDVTIDTEMVIDTDKIQNFGEIWGKLLSGYHGFDITKGEFIENLNEEYEDSNNIKNSSKDIEILSNLKSESDNNDRENEGNISNRSKQLENEGDISDRSKKRDLRVKISLRTGRSSLKRTYTLDP